MSYMPNSYGLMMLQVAFMEMEQRWPVELREVYSNWLVKLAEENCSNPTVLKWLRENPHTFTKLVDIFNFLKEHITAEEKKGHGDTVDITFVSHGSIRDFMIPASCLLPLASIRDVVLYSPWNCVIYADVAYGIATGRLKPEHRQFRCTKDDAYDEMYHPLDSPGHWNIWNRGQNIPNSTVSPLKVSVDTSWNTRYQPPVQKCRCEDMHRPIKLPNHWNSLKMAGDQMIPNIMVSPLKLDDGAWKTFESLTQEHGPAGRNRIVIPFILPGREDELVPFSVVTLALSLVLLQSGFKATVHLAACLGDKKQKFDQEYLKNQYSCAANKTGMNCSSDMFTSCFCGR